VTDADHLRVRGWLPEAVLADGVVILWLEPRREQDVARAHYSTAEAVDIQARHDQLRRAGLPTASGRCSSCDLSRLGEKT